MKNPTKTRPLTADEISRLFRVLPLYWRHVFIINLATGLRISDLLQLHKSLSFPRFTIQEKKTKKIKSVLLPSWSFDSWLYLRDNSDKNGYLLHGRDTSTYRYAIKRFAKLAGINTDQVGWHSLRKTIGNIIAHSAGIHSAQIFLNHSSVETTKAYVDDTALLISNVIESFGSNL